MNTLDNLKKSAKRWLKALRAGDDAARERLERAWPGAPEEPVVRDMLHALARERGHAGWTALVRSLDTAAPAAAADLAILDSIARDLAAVYATGDDTRLVRLQRHYQQTFTLDELREAVRRRLARVGAATGDAFTLADARLLVARQAGFDDWQALTALFDGSAPRVEALPVLQPEPDVIAPGMIRPAEMRAGFSMRLVDGTVTSTEDVWEMLAASRRGDLARLEALVAGCPQLVRCAYNYMPPLHLAVREGHVEVVRYLCDRGAANPNHETYPYRERLTTVAEDRGYAGIAQVLREQYARETAERPADEGAEILYERDDERVRFQKLVAINALTEVGRLLDRRPELARDPWAFWGEGILSMPANRGHHQMIELLLRHGARVPRVTKWGHAYYLKRDDIAALLLDRGMDASHMNCHHTTLLHDMAFMGDATKAALLLDHGADIDAVDEEFQSTPLGLAARWGHVKLVKLLLDRGADRTKAGAPWATPRSWARMKGHKGVERLL